LWPTALSLGAAWIAQLFGCETDFNRAIPCTINGEEWGQTIYVLLAIWLAALLIYLLIRFVRRRKAAQ
jgi:hypothetical protein